MSRYKEDIEEAKQNLAAWWDHELRSRPILSYWTPKPKVRLSQLGDILEYFDPFFLAEFWDKIDEALEEFERQSELIMFEGEAIPRFLPTYGPGIMASVFGISPKFQSRTVWFHSNIGVEDIENVLEDTKINMNNPWFERLVRVTRTAAKHGGKDYCVGMTDLGGILDVISSFLGPTKTILTMRRDPALIDRCRNIIMDKWMKVYNVLQSEIEQHSFGCNSWMNIWCPKRWYPIQCDFSAFLSPKWFERFALPDIKTQAEQFDYAVYHLDGPDALKHLDSLLEIDALDGIQWVPGAGNELKCSDEWLPVYKKIQDAGKSAIIDYFELPERLNHFYKELDPRYLFISTVFTDYYRAQFQTPEFIGGHANKGNFRAFKKELRRKLQKA